MDNPRDILNQVVSFEQQGRYERALLVISTLPDPIVQQRDWLVRRCRLLRQLGRYEEALLLLLKSPHREQTGDLLQELLQERANFLLSLGCRLEADPIQQQVLEQEPSDERSLTNRGISFAETDEYEKALECFDQAIQLNPNCEMAWYNKGCALLDQGRSADAINCLDKTIAINRANAMAWLQKAVCLMDLAEKHSTVLTRGRRLEEARQCLGKALRIAPNLQEAKDLLEKF